MSDIQRYDLIGDGGQYDLELDPVDDGGYVIWEDHVEALREAEQRGVDGFIGSQAMQVVRSQAEGAGYSQGYEQGQRDALAGAVQRVEALVGFEYGSLGSFVNRAEIIAAIKGENDE